MVSEIEYLDALKVVETYRIERYLETSKVGSSITCKEFYIRYKNTMSTRLRNVFKYNIVDNPFYHYMVDLDTHTFINFRNVGQKVYDEYLKLIEDLESKVAQVK